MAKSYATDARRASDDARASEAIRALNALQKEYADVLAITGYCTLPEVAKCPISWKPYGPNAENKMSRAKLIRALKLLRNTDINFDTLQDAIRQTIF